MPTIFQLLTFEESSKLTDEVNKNCHEIWKEYFSHEDYNEFLAKYLFGDSPVQRALAYRVMSQDLYHQLAKRVFEQVKLLNIKAEGEEIEELLCHPIFYIRKLTKDVYHRVETQKSLFESQPHFDRTFDTYAFTVWIALTEVNEKTGGVCWFEDPTNKIEKYKSSWGEKNVLGFTNYIQNFQEIDRDFIKTVKTRSISSGQCYLFDSNMLHGGTKPTENRERISFDMRFVPVTKKNKTSIKREIRDFQRNIDNWSALNLLTLGDQSAATSKAENVEELEKQHSLPRVDKKPFEKPFDKVHWSTEYSWTRN